MFIAKRKVLVVLVKKRNIIVTELLIDILIDMIILDENYSILYSK